MPSARLNTRRFVVDGDKALEYPQPGRSGTRCDPSTEIKVNQDPA
jgi:hypothetical protein